MANGTTPVGKNFTCWEVPSLFSKSVDDFKKVADLVRNFFDVIGTFGEWAGTISDDYFTPVKESLKTTSDYISATKTFAIIFSWIPDSKGVIPACKTEGNKFVKGFSTAFFQFGDTMDTIRFMDRLKMINLSTISSNLGKILSYVKSGCGIAGSVLGIVDAGIAIKKTADSMTAHHLVFDPVGLLFGNGLIHQEEGAPVDPNLDKHVNEAYKNIRNATLTVVNSALKTTLIVFGLLNMAANPAMGFVGLVFGITSVTAIIAKGYDAKPDPANSQTQRAWNLVDQLNVPVKA